MYIEVLSVFLFGLAVGSFLNVCVYRIPNGLSVIKPRSMCPSCKSPIPWHLNIPLLSYIFLRGRCGNCSSKISVIYPIIELCFALMLLHIFFHYGYMESKYYYVSYYGIFLACLFTASIIDLQHYIIPDEINLFGMVCGILGSCLFPHLVNKTTFFAGLIHSLSGIAVGFLLLRIVVWLGGIVFKKEAMGLGDPKFLAMIGAFLGYKLVILVILLSSFLGALIGGVFVLFFRKDKNNTVVPYGPFLALGGYIAFFWGNEIINWYVNLLKVE